MIVCYGNPKSENRIINVYTFKNRMFNIDLDNYVKNELYNILCNKIHYEIIDNILDNMDINYQWIQIRKMYNLVNAPLNLDFNVKNYKNICEKYLTNLTIAFIVNKNEYYEYPGNDTPILYYLFTTKFVNYKNIDDNQIDLFYSLTKESANIHSLYEKGYEPICINNLKLEEIEKQISQYAYDDFINEVLENKKWEACFNINLDWNDPKHSNDNDYHVFFQDDFQMVYLNRSYTVKDFLHALDRNYYHKKCYVNFEKINFTNFIKEITCRFHTLFTDPVDNILNLPYEHVGIGIIIDNKIALSNYTIVIIIYIDLEGFIKTVKINNLSLFKRTSILDLIKDYGKIINIIFFLPLPYEILGGFTSSACLRNCQ